MGDGHGAGEERVCAVEGGGGARDGDGLLGYGDVGVGGGGGG